MLNKNLKAKSKSENRMKILEPLFLNAIEKLLQNKVEFLLIGGYAVNYYGFNRYTGDMDFWINPTEQNKFLFLNALRAMDCSIKTIEAIDKLKFPVPEVFSLNDPPLRIDFLTQVNLVKFEEAWPKKKVLKISELELPVVDYHSLILMKINTGRGKDKIDVEELNKINQHSSDKSIREIIKNFLRRP